MNTKQFFFALNTDDTDEFLDTKKGFYREMYNMIPGNEFTSNPSRQNMKGNTRISIDFDETAGNICISSCTDNGRNRMVFFIHKPGGTDAIYLWNSGQASAVKIFEWSGLNFTTANPVEHAFIIDDLLYWVEKSNPQRCLNIQRALEGDYIGNEIEINLAKTPPILPAVAVKTTSRDTELTSNRISANNYHFSYRFKYKDGIYSTIAPFSKMVRSGVDPNIDDIFRSINVTITVPEDLEDYVDEIDFLVDQNKLNTWRIFNTYKNINTSVTQNITASFDGQDVLSSLAESEYESLFEPIPKRSSVQAFIKNRNIINSFLNAHNDDGTYDMTVDLLINNIDDPTEWSNEFTAKNRQFHFKAGGGYSAAIFFYDDFMRLTTIKKKVPINIPFETYDNTSFTADVWDAKRYIPRLNIVGTPPSVAKYFSIGITKESNYDLYMQVPVTVMFYVAEYNEGDVIPGTAFRYQNSIYLEDAPSDFSSSTATFVHLLLPKNIPFLPDSSFQIRIMDDTVGTPLGPELIEPILEIRGSRIVVGNFGIADWSFLPVISKAILNVEIFKPQQFVSEEYYEQGEVLPIEDFVGQRFIEGDTNYVFGSTIQWAFDSVEALSEEWPTPSNNYLDAFAVTFPISVESPSRTFSASNISTSVETKIESEQKKVSALEEATTINLGKYKVNLIRGFAYQFFIKPAPYLFKGYKGFTQVPSKTIDYTKLANNHGRTIVLLEDEEEISMPNLIIPSDIYLADTQVNGLHSFNPENAYVLPYDRGNIVKIVAANEVLVIIHERNISTIYPGESYVRQGDEGSWVITDQFITQDRKLAGSLGSQDPASIVEYDGRVYGIDRLNSEPWRRSQDGVTPLATNYQTKRWFVEKCVHYIGEDVSIVGGYDPYLDAYFITFPEVPGSEAITVGFFEKFDIWCGFYDFIPERYGYVSDSFVSFKDGVPWLHNSNSVRNSFYGASHASKVKVLINDAYNQDKILKAFALESEGSWEITSITTPAGQTSRLPLAAFKKKGHAYVVDVLRDENTPAALIPSGKTALLHGREMAGPSFEITLENSDTGEVRLRYLNARLVEVHGHIIA